MTLHLGPLLGARSLLDFAQLLKALFERGRPWRRLRR
jgi:hypothetical protein